jgi:hypothetical protein
MDNYHIDINGVVGEIQASSKESAEDIFLEKFIAFVESNGWLFCGGTGSVKAGKQ